MSTVPKCPYCNSESVTSDGITEWDKDIQAWVLISNYDGGNCSDCGEEIKSFTWELS